MAFCKACGQEIGGAAFCPKCGAGQAAAAPAPAGGAAAPAAPATSGTEGISENVAGLLCYLVGWITGLIFLLIDKRPFVKFHGAQSIAFNISIIAVWIVFWIIEAMLTFITAMMHFPIGFLFIVFFPVLGLAIFATWIFLMYKAYSGEKFKLPIIGNLVEGMVK
jgi:uncharacterized membrane protein